MALPMLVSGSDCGPSNPLQGLSKRFDQDRGIQQDHFGAGRAGSLRETFRTQQPDSHGLVQDAARFFSSNTSPPNAFDFSALQKSLIHALPPVQKPHVQQHHQHQQQQDAMAAWAADFIQQQPIQSSARQILNAKQDIQGQQHASMNNPQPQGGMQWNPAFSGYRQGLVPNFTPAIPMQAQKPSQHTDQKIWEKEFQSQEISLNTFRPAPLQEVQQNQQTRGPTPAEQDDLARTAGLLVESVSHEQNPKFQNSQFLGLMRQLRDREIVVEGDQMVDRDASSLSSGIHVDVKGKGRALESPLLPADRTAAPRILAAESLNMTLLGAPVQPTLIEDDSAMQQEDPNDAYFRLENEEYSHYWDAINKAGVPQAASASWDHLQNQWDAFEATSTGIKPITNYQFQTHNPYLLGDSSRTRHHMLHADAHQRFLDSVLELEAAVQRDPTNASAWFELGIKQQENEREQKALEALQRAVELDPTYQPTWLALAISHTNDGNRLETYNSIRRWVDLDAKHEKAVQQFFAASPESSVSSVTERLQNLIQCLISMVRGNASGQVDADIQIALAVLLNTIEDYDKAQDCFQTALAVRPDDWLLYNRVGATMANSGRADAALEYYYRALEINPSYIRARYNLGISCMNLRRYEESAQHVLDALELQESDGVRDPAGMNDKRGVTSDALWDSLKTTCLHMQRIDLATLCDSRDIANLRNSFQA